MAKDLTSTLINAVIQSQTLEEHEESAARLALYRALTASGGNRQKTQQELQISRRSFYRLLEKHSDLAGLFPA